MTRINPVGDLVLTDPQAMRALADPVRLTLVDRLRRAGQATAAELSQQVHADPAAVEAHLRELERFGFVAGDDGRWRAFGKGVFFEIPDDPEGQAAARRLSNVMLLHYVDVPRRWVAEDEPGLDLDWARAAGLFNARVSVTADELRGIQEELERVLEPYLNRAAGEVPAGAGPVRILSYFLPGGR
jgi:DNA-binding transcriptional ArsR family regulator